LRCDRRLRFTSARQAGFLLHIQRGVWHLP
jgi:hypothetical protein